MSATSREIVYLRVEQGGEESLLVAPVGTTLRKALLANGLSPYTRITEGLNCGGRGLCATCGVRFADEDEPTPEHWHDDLAARFGFPRLSCQIAVEGDMDLWIPDKLVWGSRHDESESETEN